MSATKPTHGRPWGGRARRAPVAHDTFPIGFSQHIGANEPLRAGSYSTAVTFTLSTDTP
jgi:hypothetical protein